MKCVYVVIEVNYSFLNKQLIIIVYQSIRCTDFKALFMKLLQIVNSYFIIRLIRFTILLVLGTYNNF